jgi:hypothetical protein
MTPIQLAELKNNETLRKSLAKFMARECFRSSPSLEDMHTEGKIGQEDMKELMIDVVNRTYLLLSVLASSNGSEVVEILKEHDMVPKWNEPDMPEELLKNAKRAYDAMRQALH